MYLIERRGDVFSAEETDVFFAHSISADFALSVGIATQFDERYNMREKLRARFPDAPPPVPCCIMIDRVLNLVTKERVGDKPTERSLGMAVMGMASLCRRHGIKKIAMPRIGCEIDELPWDRVREIMGKVFAHDDIVIVVYYR